MAVNLADLTDPEKVEFLLTELQDAAEVLGRYGHGNRQLEVVREMRGEVEQEAAYG